MGFISALCSFLDIYLFLLLGFCMLHDFVLGLCLVSEKDEEKIWDFVFLWCFYLKCATYPNQAIWLCYAKLSSVLFLLTISISFSLVLFSHSFPVTKQCTRLVACLIVFFIFFGYN